MDSFFPRFKKIVRIIVKYEAYFKDYLDPHSWYCTYVGTKLGSDSPSEE